MTKLMVIGGAGFLGSALVRELSKVKKNQIIVFDSFANGFPKAPFVRKNILSPISGNLRNYYDILRAIERFVPDVIFHLAAPAVRPETLGNFRECAEVNYLGTANLAQACLSATHRPRQIIFASSLAARDPQTHHGISKRAAEDLLRSIFSRFPELGTDVTVLRFSEIYGNSTCYTSTALVNFLVDNLLQQNNISLFSPHKELDNLHITDAVKACELALDLEAPFSVLDIGTGIGSPIKAVVEKLRSLIPTKSQLRYLESHKVPVETLIADTEPARTALGFTAQADFDVELKLLINQRKKTFK